MKSLRDLEPGEYVHDDAEQAEWERALIMWIVFAAVMVCAVIGIVQWWAQ